MIEIKSTSWYFLLSLGVIFFGLLFFLFIIWLPSADHTQLCIKPLLYIHCLSNLFWFHLVFSEIRLDHLYIGFKMLLEIILFPQNMNFQLLHILISKMVVFYKQFSNVYIPCLLIFQSLFLLFNFNNHVPIVIFDFMWFCIYISSIISLFSYILFFFF